MDNDIAWTIDSNIVCKFRVLCSCCNCQYFYKINTEIQYRGMNTHSLIIYGKARCTSCNYIINTYDSDILTEIGRIEWITI